MKIYDLTERTQSVSEASSGQGDKLPDYATKDDLGKVVGVVKGIDDVLASLRQDIDTIKGDMYGIAGKKKTVKKTEAEDDA